MYSKKVTRRHSPNMINIDESCEENMGEPRFLNHLEVEPVDFFQLKTQQEAEPKIDPRTPETCGDDIEQYYQAILSSFQSQCQKTQSFFSNKLLQNTDNKNDKFMDLRYFQGHLAYLSSLKFPIFGQNSRFDRTKKRSAVQGYFACIARSMKKFKKNKLDTDYAKRYDQGLQNKLRLRAQEDENKILTSVALKKLNKARGDEDNQILNVFFKKYNAKRHWAVFLKKMVSSESTEEIYNEEN